MAYYGIWGAATTYTSRGNENANRALTTSPNFWIIKTDTTTIDFTVTGTLKIPYLGVEASLVGSLSKAGRLMAARGLAGYKPDGVYLFEIYYLDSNDSKYKTIRIPASIKKDSDYVYLRFRGPLNIVGTLLQARVIAADRWSSGKAEIVLTASLGYQTFGAGNLLDLTIKLGG